MTQWGVDTLFNPAKRHMDEEKRRLQSTRSEVGDNSGGKRIDLESGKVVIQKADDDETAEADAPATSRRSKAARRSDGKSDAKSDGKSDGKSDAAAEKKLTPAQQRALDRRAKARK